MSKKSKSKNSIVKKAKKFQRQGKFEKAIKLCDDYLDNEKLEESIIQIKVDNLSDLFYQKNLSEKFTRYTNELDYFLDMVSPDYTLLTGLFKIKKLKGIS